MDKRESDEWDANRQDVPRDEQTEELAGPPVVRIEAVPLIQESLHPISALGSMLNERQGVSTDQKMGRERLRPLRVSHDAHQHLTQLALDFGLAASDRLKAIEPERPDQRGQR